MTSPQRSDSPSKGRLLTVRSVFFSLLGIVWTSGLAGFHDWVLGGSPMIGNFLPVGAFTYFMFVGLFWNGLWSLLDRLLGRRLGVSFSVMALSPRELIVVMVCTLVACFPPTSGLFRYFHRQLMLPWMYVGGQPHWQEYGLLTEQLRPELFPPPWPGAGEDVASTAAFKADYKAVYEAFFTGMATNQGTVSFFDLPLSHWVRPMLYWTPLLVLFVLTLVSLQFVVHRQWAHHEQLSYPVAQVTGAFTRRADGRRGVPDLFRNRLFWWGFLPVFLLLFLDYLSGWYPQDVPGLNTMMPNLRSWWLPITNELPLLKKSYSGAWYINGQSLYFTFFGIAYFVSAEISLSVGLAPFLLLIFSLLYYSTTGDMLQEQTLGAARQGAYLGYTLILIYTGRTYFKALFARALGLRRRRAAPAAKDASAEDAEASKAAADLAAPDDVSVVAARVLMIAFAGFVLVLSWMCQSWLMALFFSLLLLAMYLVVSRILCETGIPFLQTGWSPINVILNVFGPAAVGPRALTYLLWGGTAILAQDPRESLMPYVATGVKVADDAGLRLRRIFRIVVAAVLTALVVAWIGSMFSIYNYGPGKDSWANDYTPKMYFDQAQTLFGEMKSSGVLEQSEALQADAVAGPIRRLGLAQPNAQRSHYILYGALAVFVLSALRFRFSRFPFHPVIVLVAGTYPGTGIWWCFLLGWFVKQLVVRFGGGGVYQRLKPAFIGVIAGEMACAGTALLVQFAHYWRYDTPASITGWFLPG